MILDITFSHGFGTAYHYYDDQITIVSGQSTWE